MDRIIKKPIKELGYKFIERKYIPEAADEYYIRNQQLAETHGEANYRPLSAYEIEVLVKNNNVSDNWNNVMVTDQFDPDLVKRSHFYGLVRIRKLEPYFLEFHNLQLPVGIYNSTVISCDLGDNVVIDNVNSLSHYIIGNESILVNVNEMTTTAHAKFGNGIVKKGEKEAVRIWIELRNENGGRKIMPFAGMLPGDAFLWSKHRGDKTLMKRFKTFTEKRFDSRRGYYGTVGSRSVIKNCKILKDVKIGENVYIKGAHKLKNLTIEGSKILRTQIGEGCELVNGIVSQGCRVFYGVKAVRFFMAPFSSLKYGARLINSYLGSNSTISCCEVLNSLIYPGHEQHHNNSFLCAAFLGGQSNMAAGATIGSNHNSRGADGELVAKRGFWPGLSVSLKHNSQFASFSFIAKGTYPAEINLPFPFSLISNHEGKDRLIIIPAFWFMYNMYALERNSWKYDKRDHRIDKVHRFEFDFLAPDSTEEIVLAIERLERACGQAFYKEKGLLDQKSASETRIKGHQLLTEKSPIVQQLFITLDGIERSKRPPEIIKVQEAYDCYLKMLHFYMIKQLVRYNQAHPISSLRSINKMAQEPRPRNWVNIGGQLFTKDEEKDLIKKIKTEQINHWEEVHLFYQKSGESYEDKKLRHALSLFYHLWNKDTKSSKSKSWLEWIKEGEGIVDWVLDQLIKSRKKDYSDPFRIMTFDDRKEINEVLGDFEKDQFIIQSKKNAQELIGGIKEILKQVTLPSKN